MSTPRRMNHKERESLLGALATLSGCSVRLAKLPDGSIPDVLHTDIGANTLFIGDAKHSESPGNTATQLRMLGYLRWLNLYVNRDPQRRAVFALAVGATSHLKGWSNTITFLAHEAGLPRVTIHTMWLGQRLYIVWFVVIGVESMGRATDARIHSRVSASDVGARMRAGFN